MLQLPSLSSFKNNPRQHLLSDRKAMGSAKNYGSINSSTHGTEAESMETPHDSSTSYFFRRKLSRSGMFSSIPRRAEPAPPPIPVLTPGEPTPPPEPPCSCCTEGNIVCTAKLTAVAFLAAYLIAPKPTCMVAEVVCFACCT